MSLPGPTIIAPTPASLLTDPAAQQDYAARQRWGQRLYLPDHLFWDLGSISNTHALGQVGFYRWVHRAGVVRGARLLGNAGAGISLQFDVRWQNATIQHSIFAAAPDKLITTGGVWNILEKPATGASLIVDPNNPATLGIFWINLDAVGGVGTVDNIYIDVLIDPVETN